MPNLQFGDQSEAAGRPATQQIGGPRCTERDAGDDYDVIAGFSELSRERGIAGKLGHRRLIGDFVFDHDGMNSPHRR
jgi:hypothetical protein